MAERSSALDSSSDAVRMWVRILAWPVAALVSLSKTLNHNCFVLRMGRKAVGPVCCVMHVKEPRTLIVKEKGLIAPVFLDSRLEHPAGWICARYKSYHYHYCYYYHAIKLKTNLVFEERNQRWAHSHRVMKGMIFFGDKMSIVVYFSLFMYVFAYKWEGTSLVC